MSDLVSVKQVELYTKKKINELITQFDRNTALFAQLRRGIGKEPGDIPQLWGIIFESMPETFYGNLEPSRAEWAVYTSLTLFALHQQGKEMSENLMQIDGQSLGTAISYLIHDQTNRERIIKRFNIVATSSNIEELSHHLRGVVQMLRGDNIGLDYAKLAGDIYCFQFQELASRVRLRWGQDFYRKSFLEQSKDENNGGN